MKKLFCIDIDGTLLKSDGKVSSKTISVLRKLIEQGHYVVLCSARSRESALKIARLIKTSNFIITSNGAEIYNYKFNQVLYVNSINYEIIKQLWSECNLNNIKISFAVDNKEYVNNLFWKNQIIIDKVNCLKKLKIKQCMLVSNDYNKLRKLFDNRFQYSSLKSACNKVEYDECGYWFNLLSSDSSKGFAVAYLADYLGIDRKNIISFGNDFNDISMFKVSGKSLIVENGDKDIFSYADEVISSNDADGIAMYLEKNLL